MARVRRVSTDAELLACLDSDDDGVVPICFSDAERPWIARTVDPGVATLGQGREQSFPILGLQGGPDDWVLASVDGIARALAVRYALSLIHI